MSETSEPKDSAPPLLNEEQRSRFPDRRGAVGLERQIGLERRLPKSRLRSIRSGCPG